MIKNYFVNRIPTEIEVVRIFQLNEIQSRSLLKDVITSNRYDLGSEVRQTLESCLCGFELSADDDSFLGKIHSLFILVVFNSIIAERGASDQPIIKMGSTSKMYQLTERSLNILKEELGIND